MMIRTTITQHSRWQSRLLRALLFALSVVYTVFGLFMIALMGSLLFLATFVAAVSWLLWR